MSHLSCGNFRRDAVKERGEGGGGGGGGENRGEATTPPKADSREANASLQGQVSYLVND